jgi:putative DNA primase/helicase
MNIDTAELLSRIDIADVVAREVSLKRKGTELVGLCPFHNDTKASMYVNQKKQLFKCFACGAGGDAIEFLRLGGMSFHESVDYLDGKTGTFRPSPVALPVAAKTPSNTIMPVPADAPRPPDKKSDLVFVKRWEYRDIDGALMGYTVRFAEPDGGKAVFPQTYVMRDGKPTWAWAGFPKPRPIYGLPKLKAKPKASVMIVEGEKAADHAQTLFPDLVCVSWVGGTDGITHIDWSPLAGRKVVIWPDNDEAGVKAARWIGQHLATLGCVVRYVTPPDGTPKGWDIADSEWTSEQALAYVRADGVQIKTPPEPNYAKAIEVEVHTLPPAPPAPPPTPPAKPEPKGMEFGMFKFLGFEKTESSQAFCFYVNRSKTIVRITAGSMTKNNLMTLVPDPTWWEAHFPSKRGMEIDMAVAWLLEQSYRRGMFDESLVRGRGAWIDAGRVVLHSGDYLVADGIQTKLGELESRYMYEQANSLKFPTESPLSSAEANKLMDVLNLVNWERPVNAYLLAGWCVIAPVCGALQWRPHIWVTGGAGTGKSWILERVVRVLLGDTGLAVQGETTEAGLRQTLRHDAMPIVFDEADTDGKSDNERIQKVLAIMRSASSSDGGKIIKGSAGGRAQDFNIKSCFALGSIAVQAAKQADKTRISVLAIRRILDHGEREQRWTRLQKLHHDIITPEYSERLQARTVRILPVILDNARTFAAAAGAELNYQRTGDQIGTLLAGAYSLYSDKRISYDDAVKWIQAQDWSEERGLDEQRDEDMLLNYILEQVIRVEHGYNMVERTIGELVLIASRVKIDEGIGSDIANTRLSRHGIRAAEGYMVVSNNSDWIRRILDKTPWAHGHAKILARIDGARKTEPVRFGGGLLQRGVAIPMHYITD